ncbi:GAF domain-containing protein [Endozoicomonas sp. SM1973]|uniref:GAF domain-containing protein n=1 Tax=Spartinivicinus marinus TaxID=2994442 RepID=A0A853I7W9_9GAMM|nr:GAF domain-containing protein [Spartinivicinus marinus]MCX4025280.1 GAF domain-containing protein [Spartinivicinus marinus]NYZ66001.1 GAF domain-containing protein [Spartinivicinus marinus]
MFQLEPLSSVDNDKNNKTESYQQLLEQVKSLTQSEPNIIANLANISSLLFWQLTDINWAGFYLNEGNQLVLGPFQGKPACIRIPVGKGVCGVAAATGEVQRVANVHHFTGHIACDANTNSEIVLPLKKQGQVKAVLDIDSPVFDRFDEQDQEGLLAIVSYIESLI